MSRNQTLFLFFIIAALVVVVFGKVGKKVAVTADLTQQHFQ